MNTSRIHLWICAGAAALLFVLISAALNSPLAQYDQPHCKANKAMCDNSPRISRLLP